MAGTHRGPYMKSMQRWLAAVAVCLLAAACAAPTPYRAAMKGEGYSDHPIEEGRYSVSFSGNTSTPRRTVEDYMLYRAAELTLAQGKDHFRIVRRHTEERAQTVTRYEDPWWPGFVGPGYPYPHRVPSGLAPWAYDPFSPVPTYRPRTKVRETISTYDAHAEIVLGAGPKPAGDVDAYDARDVIAKLGPALRRPTS